MNDTFLDVVLYILCTIAVILAIMLTFVVGYLIWQYLLGGAMV